MLKGFHGWIWNNLIRI
jgi:hypothetical protein